MNRLTNAALALFAGTRVGDALAALFDRYEAAVPFTPDRSHLPAFVRDARYDANSWTRWELTRKILYFERNTWLVQRIRDEFVKWTVGPNGLQVMPASSDSEWNKSMLESYLEWCEAPCLDSTLTMPQVHRLEAGTFQLLGEVFVNETRRKVSGKPSRPALQLIESHRCSSPGTEYSYQESDDLVDGVQLVKEGDRCTGVSGYWVKDGFQTDGWTFRSVENMHHVFDPERIGMYRGITPYHAVLNTLHDIDDLEIMEMQRAKQNSERAWVLENNTGEMPAHLQRGNRWGLQAGNTGTPGTTETKDEVQKRMDAYRRVYGSRGIAIKNGEKIIELDNKNPSAATQWYWRYKIGQICAASNVPLILIFPELVEGMQGTVVRGVYDNAHEFFRSRFFIFSAAARRKYRFYANWARYNDPRCVDAPADWDACHITPPRAVNVDVGRNSVADLAEYAAGTKSLEDIAGARGTTGDVLTYRKARGIARVKQIAEEVSKEFKVEVKPEEIMGSLADIVQKLASANAAEPEAEETETKKEPVAA